MRRRDFIKVIGGTAAAWPLAVRAQQKEGTPHIGVLLGLADGHPETRSRVKAFQKGLRDRGWVEGQNIRTDYRFAGSDPNRTREYTAELVRLTPAVIVGNSTPVTERVAAGDKHHSDRICGGERSGGPRLCFERRASRRECYWLQLHRARFGREMVDNAQRRCAQDFSGQLDVQPRDGSVL